MRAAEIFRYSLAGVVVITFVGLLYLAFFRAIPAENEQAILIMLGVVAGMTKDVTQFFFGSSQGSKDKDASLAKIAKGGP